MSHQEFPPCGNESKSKTVRLLLACVGLTGLSLIYLVGNNNYLSHQSPKYFNTNGKKGFVAPGYRVQQSAYERSIVQIINAPATILDNSGLERGKEKLIAACGMIEVSPVEGLETAIWEAKVPNADECLRPQ
jgi:hypothetical protein